MEATAASVAAAKARLRRRLLTARDDLGPDGRKDQARSVTHALLRWAPMRDLPPGSITAAYVGVGTEPPTTDLLAAMDAQGLRVLLPIWRHGTTELDWATYTGVDDLTRARAGLLEPRGGPMGPEAIGQAAVIVVPALAVDRAGNRLGRGAGAYDAALRLADPVARTCALLYTGEFLDQIPVEPHDQLVSAVALPGGVVELPKA